MAVEFGLLGTIEARVDGRPAGVGHLRQRCVLAALLVDANRPVPVDELIDRLWGGRPPQQAKGTLYGYLSRLRQALNPASGVRIVRQPEGYLLQADPLSVDLHLFRSLVAQARTADDEQAAALLRQALELWRGEPFATVDTPWFCDLRQALERERFSAELDDTEIRLRRGLHRELLPALTARAREHPLDERLAGQLILAHYYGGRSVDALNHYQSVRRGLAEELGVDPGAPLQQLHQQILAGDPALALPAAAQPAPRSGTAAPTPLQLPARPRWFTGRDRQLAELGRALAFSAEPGGSVMISAIGGGGGIGKTWLALHWAHQNIDRFPDGQLYVDLRGFDPSAEPVALPVAVRGFLDALGVDPASVPVDLQAQIGLYRSLVEGRRMLIVLDNATDAEQAAALLPGSASCTVLVTSRRRLWGLVSAHGAQMLTLGVLTDTEAQELMSRHLGQDRLAAEPGFVAALLEHCAGLPLAISVVGARAAAHPDFPLAVLAEELQNESERLDALDTGDLSANVRAVFAVSYRALAVGAAEVFRLVGLAPGPEIGLAAIASLVARPVTAVRAALRELENAHVIQQPVPGRYRMHDLTRLYAAEQAQKEQADGSDEALTRLLDFYLHTAHTAARWLEPHRYPIQMTAARPGVTPQDLADHSAALVWFTIEHLELLSAIDLAARTRRDVHAWQLAWFLETFFDYHGHCHDWVVSQHIALDAAQRLGNRSWEAAAHRSLGIVCSRTGRLDDAHTHHRQALDLYDDLEERVGQAHTHRCLGALHNRQGNLGKGLAHAKQALALYRQTDHAAGQARALNNVGFTHVMLGDYRSALHYCVQAVALSQEVGDGHGEAGAWDSLGYVHHHLNEFTEALDCYRRALELDRSYGDRYGQAEILDHLGDTHLAVADPEAAGLAWHQALEIADEIGHPSTTELRGKLSGLLHGLPTASIERA